MNFTQEDIKYIIETYKQTKDIDFIIQKYQCEEHDIRIILKTNQIDRVYNKFDEELSNRIIQLRLKGMLNKDIRYQLLISDVGIHKTLARNDIPRITYTERNRRIERNSNYFDIINNQNKAYLLGLLYADGCNHVEHNNIVLCLQDTDKYIVEWMKNQLEYKGHILYIAPKKENHHIQYRLSINDEHMSNRLVELGIVNNKSLILQFPTEEQCPSKFLSHFIRGYFDGDGCVNIYKDKCTTQITGTKEFLTGISNIMFSMGIRNNMHHPKQSSNSNTYILHTSANNSSYQFLHWIYQDSEMKMERKYQKYLQLCKQCNLVA